jgi:hypothetical protein
MARIVLNQPNLVQTALLRLTSDIVLVRSRAMRLKAIADQITNNGAQKVNLETSQESAFPVGSGVLLYDGIASIDTQLATLAALVSAVDQNG